VRRRLAASALVGAVAIATVGCTDDPGSGSPHETTEPSPGVSATVPATSPVYSLAATRRCLEEAGLLVGPVGTRDPRLRALGDLAQRTSVTVMSGGEVVGLAFGDAELLADLLAVPDDPYTIETRGNAVLLYRPAARPQAAAVRRCLRS
jgi:8-oxo-dGTP pyrophosphatase MutT (NUDIX family)